MEEPQSFKLTPKQSEALDLAICDTVKNLMLYGGSRSGKTFFLVWAIFMRAVLCPDSRHCILRLRFKHAKRAIWLDTIPKVLKLCFPGLNAKPNKTDFYYKLPNGSEVWVGGLDDSDRVEAILGNEYSTMYFNECSQLDFSSISMARTRLAQKNSLIKKAYYDQNPPPKSHFSYWLFERKIHPKDDEPLENPDEYASLLMNPIDNMDNIDEEYLELLGKMSEVDRARFLRGEYQDESDGMVYYAFRRDLHVQPTEKKPGTIYVFMDFNVNPMTAVLAQDIDDKLVCIDEVFLPNSDTPRMCIELVRRGYSGLEVIPDSTARNRKTSGQTDFDILKGHGFKVASTYNPAVKDRVNNVNRLFGENNIIIDPKCKKLINDLERVMWKDNKLDQKSDPMLTHISDALGYGCHKLKPYFKMDLTPRSGSR
jgi:phage terminase large subunit